MENTIYIHEMQEPAGCGAFAEDQLNERSEDIGDRKIDLSKIDNIEFDDVDFNDAPDYCDAYISSADMDGIQMSDTELDDLNANHKGFVYEMLIDKLLTPADVLRLRKKLNKIEAARRKAERKMNKLKKIEIEIKTRKNGKI